MGIEHEVFHHGLKTRFNLGKGWVSSVRPNDTFLDMAEAALDECWLKEPRDVFYVLWVCCRVHCFLREGRLVDGLGEGEVQGEILREGTDLFYLYWREYNLVGDRYMSDTSGCEADVRRWVSAEDIELLLSLLSEVG
jgi:hypothetical protein